MTLRRIAGGKLSRVVRSIGVSVALSLAVVGASASTAAFAQAAPDAFYLALLRDGKSEMLRGDAVAAKKSFRLACFGFLEQPVLLAEGLVRLGLAESRLNDSEAFIATFTRLAEVEDRFAAYAPAALTAEERRAFEEKALEWVAPDVLRSLPAFAPILARKSEVDLAKLASRERTRELEKRAAASPADPRYKVLLAQDEAAGERWAKVLGRLDGVADAAEGESAKPAAGCLRGLALARLKRCEEATVSLGSCATVTSDAVLAEAQLACLVGLERDAAARLFAGQIVRPAADAAAVKKAIARVPAVAKPPQEKKKGPVKEEAAPEARAASPNPPVKAQPKPAPVEPKASDAKASAAKSNLPPQAPAKAPAVVAPAPATAAAPAKPTASRLSADEERVVAQAREMLGTVENRDELRRGVALVQPIADRLPERADLQLLAGEIAYRAGLWTTAAEYFKRSTPQGTGPTDPTQRFYYAVCLYEAGNFAAAAQVASSGLEKLQRLPFVDGYLQKIRAARP